MWGSLALYTGVALTIAGLALVVRPVKRLRIPSRLRALALAATGLAVVFVSLLLPTFESRSARIDTHLDEFVPSWQFREIHSLAVAAPPVQVFEAIKRVRADEILLFQTLTWIRRGGRQAPPSILNAVGERPLLDVATSTGFIMLADEAPGELVVGLIVLRPPGGRAPLTPDFFRKPVPEGYAVAAMNFVVRAAGNNRSVVTTETRVFASGRHARRRFAAYWRTIYPGSALIRRMWLRAIRERVADQRATSNARLRQRLRRASPTPKAESIESAGWKAHR
jgi:hypothetical protein